MPHDRTSSIFQVLARRPGRGERRWTDVLVLLVAALLLLPRLGHYALWDDEARTGLIAQGVWETGDTSAHIGHNFVAYNYGMELRDLHDRWQAPLQDYLAAPFVGVLGATPLAARLPFALCGIGCVALMLHWHRRSDPTRAMTLLLAAATLGNVAMLLFFRQARYYAPSILLSTAVAYFYCRYIERTCRPGTLVWILVCSLLLLATNYLAWLALYVCMGIDFLIWGRQTRRPPARHWIFLLLPQLIAGLILASIWNPWRNQTAPHHGANSILQKLDLAWWFLRDLNANEFGAVPFFVGGVIAFGIWANRWGLRAATALAAYVLVAGAIAPESVEKLDVAEVRYIAPVIPLCIAMTVLMIAQLGRRWPVVAALLAVVAIGSNAIEKLMSPSIPLRSTPVAYVHELIDPLPEPYTPTSDWIRRNIPEGKSVWVAPTHAVYPLMFNAPGPVYAWLFKPNTVAVPEIYIEGMVAPDFIISFGSFASATSVMAQSAARGHPYEPVATIDVYCRDEYRPEITWRRFTPRADFDRSRDAVFIYRLAN